MAYRDPLPTDPPFDEPGFLGELGPKRAAYYRQRDEDFRWPRYTNVSTAALRAELDVVLFAKIDRLQATLERLAVALERE